MIWLLLLPAAAFLAYRKRSTANAVSVPSLYLLDSLKTKSTKTQKFTFPPKLFVDLLILCLLAIAANEFLLKGKSEVLDIVIDNSFHSRAKLKDGQTLLQHYKAEVKNNLTPGYFNVFQTSPAKKLNSDPVSLSAAVDIIEGIQPGEGRAGAIKVGAQAITASIKDTGNYRNIVQKQDLENIYIKSLSAAEAGFRVEIGTSLLRPKNVEVAVQLDSGRVVSQQLEVFGEKSVLFSAEPSAIQQVSISAQGDSILEDNQLAYKSKTAPSKVITFVSETDVGDLFLTSLSVRKIKPAQYDPSSSGLFVFNRFVPDKLPGSSTVFVLPNKAFRGFFDKPEIINNPEISSWDSSTNIMRYLRPELVSLSRALKISSEQLRPVLESNQGSILSVSDKLAVVGFELFPFKGDESAFQSVLLLNLISWASGASEVNYSASSFTEESETLSLPSLLIAEEIREQQESWWKELSYVVLALMALNLLLLRKRGYC